MAHQIALDAVGAAIGDHPAIQFDPFAVAGDHADRRAAAVAHEQRRHAAVFAVGQVAAGMQAELVAKNRLVGHTLDQLQKLYDSLDRDLIEARKLQQTLVRDRNRDFGAGSAALLMRPSGHVGGDLVGSFVINQRRIGVYAVDVSGHGVASAMMTARLAGLLSGATEGQNIALTTSADGQRDASTNHETPTTVALRSRRASSRAAALPMRSMYRTNESRARSASASNPTSSVKPHRCMTIGTRIWL